MVRSFLTSLLALAFIHGAAAVAHSELITPAGLNPGDSFRFVFVTSTGRNAGSPNIADYDNFVTQAATAAGLTSYGGTDVSWQALASAALNGRNVIDRIGWDSPAVYLITGEKVANSGYDLWDGGDLHHEINSTELGGQYNGDVWTGTYYDGKGIHRLGSDTTSSGYYGISYGYSGPLSAEYYGDPAVRKWIWAGESYSPESALPLYAISSVVTAAVPEPGSLALMLSGIAVMVNIRLCRRRRNAASRGQGNCPACS